MERGIHINSQIRNNDNGTSAKEGSKIMLLAIENLEQNLNEVDLDGTLLSSILKSNKRSQNFTLKHHLNIGEPTSQDELTYKWEQPIKSFVDRLPKIKDSLKKDIQR